MDLSKAFGNMKPRFITSEVKSGWVFNKSIRSDVQLKKKPKTISTNK